MIGDPVHPVPLRPPRITVIPVDYADPAAAALRRALTTEMKRRYADRVADPAVRPPAMDVEPGTVVYTAIAVTGDGLPVGHLTLRRAGEDVELKRMYVAPPYRGKGVAGALLRAAEEEARRRGARRIVLQTGDRQPDAVRLYEREGYTPIPILPSYATVWFSRCFAKVLR
ncbi:GNAT family N-acetyltransferase [Actinoallomurus iriomotensis]|uniref:N-acetyltransferase n=1 Tax=Actinoallomurus iriomotensis TaxID=478107 RepID=A0A9W6REA0_9ACTN|nr:GNAT family N-acetyltransferase [Actinoallomurus iriomotensis]GLY74201.1 N-acetyltransferase [Actinoallomurus iriomotensis]